MDLIQLWSVLRNFYGRKVTHISLILRTILHAEHFKNPIFFHKQILNAGLVMEYLNIVVSK